MLSDLDISIIQLQQDENAMFGAIVSLCQGKYATAVIEKYEQDARGIAAYIDLIGKYRLPSTVMTNKATEKLNVAFSESFPGGLQQYLLQFEVAYAMLDKVEKETAAREDRPPNLIPDHSRIQQLRGRLFHVDALRPMIDNAKTSKYTFEQTLQYFREYALSVAYSDLSNSRARSGRNRHIHTAESNPEMVPDDLEVVTLLANQALPPEF